MTAHAEAFCLMQYTSDDGTETEVIWNSRDGVTPFSIMLLSGKQATHSRWHEDVRCTEGMARSLGVRWFMDHTQETADAAAAVFVDRWWDYGDYPMSRMFVDRRAAISHFAAEWVGSPTLAEPTTPTLEAVFRG